MSGKIIISIVSLILVVGVAIGVVVAVHKKGEDPEIQNQQKYLTVVCQPAEDKKLCYETLSSVRGADAADPKAYVAAALKAATDNVIKAYNMSDRLIVEHGDKDSRIKVAIGGCKEMMEFALDSLDLSTVVVRDNDIQSVHAQDDDLRNWLSAVISYKQACMEGFRDEVEDEKKIKDQLHTETIDRATNVTVVALNIVSHLSDILQEFGLKLDLKPASRRLLSKEGFPTWVSATDRKLLAQMQANNWRSTTPPNVTVAKDGSGQFKTIMEAINSYPKGNKGRYVIYVKAGVYEEYVNVTKDCKYLTMYGDGPQNTVITGNRSNLINKITTMYTGTFSNQATGFIARDMTFRNTIGPIGQQAVAFHNQGDISAIINCHFEGYQDTLYVHANRQFYRDCVISGTIDFIFGTSHTLIQNSEIILRKPGVNQTENTITADGTGASEDMYTGIVIQNCTIFPEKELIPVITKVKSYLGRPWKELSRTVFMESNLGDVIDPKGWIPWLENGTDINIDRCYYGEYANTGLSANISQRVQWKGYRGELLKADAQKFIGKKWLKPRNDSKENKYAKEWLTPDVPHYLGFANKLNM